MRRSLDDLDPKTRESVEALRREIRELAERKTAVARRRKKRRPKGQQRGWQVDKYLNEIKALDNKIAAAQKRIGEPTTGQIDQTEPQDAPPESAPQAKGDY